MKRIWLQCMALVLLGLVPFISGCGERTGEEPASQSAVEQEPPSVAGQPGTGAGAVPITPGSEMEPKPESKQRQEPG